MKISIIIPMYNAEKTLAKCIKSLIRNEYKDYEIIVVDDASTDNSVSLAKKFKCKVISLKKNKGVGNARNIGAKASKGNILLFLDSDIVLVPSSLKAVAKAFKDNSNLSIVHGFYSKKPYDDSIFSLYKSLNHNYYGIKFAKNNQTTFSEYCGAIRKKDFFYIGGFDDSIAWAGGEEEEFISRISKKYKVKYEPKLEAIHYCPGFIQSLKKYFKRSSISTFEMLKARRVRKNFDQHPYQTFDEITAFISAIVLFINLILIFAFRNLFFSISFMILFFIFVFSRIKLFKLFFSERKKYLLLIFILINYIETLIMALGIIRGVFRYYFRRSK